MVNKNPNTKGILDHAFEKKKKKKTQNRVDEAIEVMIKECKKINFNSVSEKALVSKAYLYRDPIIRKKIEELRQQQEGIHDMRK